MKKSIFIVLAILFIIAIVICLYIYNVKKIENVAIKHNKQYEEYCNKEILGTELISLINKAIDYNEKNSVEKQENTIYYINNNTNSITVIPPIKAVYVFSSISIVLLRLSRTTVSSP